MRNDACYLCGNPEIYEWMPGAGSICKGCVDAEVAKERRRLATARAARRKPEDPE